MPVLRSGVRKGRGARGAAAERAGGGVQQELEDQGIATRTRRRRACIVFILVFL